MAVSASIKSSRRIIDSFFRREILLSIPAKDLARKLLSRRMLQECHNTLVLIATALGYIAAALRYIAAALIRITADRPSVYPLVSPRYLDTKY